MNNKKFEKIAAALDRAENETKTELEKVNNERAQIAAKIAELETKKENAASLEEFKTISAALKAENENAGFLDDREKSIKNALLDNDTARDYQKAIIEELAALKENTAAEIQPVFLNVIAQMKQYCIDYLSGVELFNRVRKSNNNRAVISARLEAWTISELENDPGEWWPQFCYLFFRYYNEAMRKENRGRKNG